jgi:hypothetical protein
MISQCRDYLVIHSRIFAARCARKVRVRLKGGNTDLRAQIQDTRVAELQFTGHLAIPYSSDSAFGHGTSDEPLERSVRMREM